MRLGLRQRGRDKKEKGKWNEDGGTGEVWAPGWFPAGRKWAGRIGIGASQTRVRSGVTVDRPTFTGHHILSNKWAMDAGFLS